MTGTCVKRKRQIISPPTPPGRKPRKQFEYGHGSGTPPPQAGEAEASSPVAPVMPRQQPQRPEGQSGLSRGALSHGKGAADCLSFVLFPPLCATELEQYKVVV